MSLKGPSRQIERRYIREYVLTRFPKRQWAAWNMPIGLPPEELRRANPDLQLRTFNSWRAYADALVHDGAVIWLIEAKINNIKRGVGDLDRYMTIVRQTPELHRFQDTEINPLLVIPLDDQVTIQHAQTRGFSVDVYRPEWVADYLRERGILA